MEQYSSGLKSMGIIKEDLMSELMSEESEEFYKEIDFEYKKIKENQ